MVSKQEARKRRARGTRAKIVRSGHARLSVHRSGRHIYAQIIAAEGGKTLAAASTVQKEVRGDLNSTSDKQAAAAVGKAIAEKAKAAGISDVAFDRSGFRYHGRVKALADAAREAGLQF